MDSLPQTYVDSIRQVYDYYMQNERARYTDAGWQLRQRRDSITADLVPFRFAYAEEHPMLWTLYDVLDAIQALKHADVYVNFDNSQFEPYLTLYHDKLINYYPGHPIHEQIATAETAYFTTRLSQLRQPTAYNRADPISTTRCAIPTASSFLFPPSSKAKWLLSTSGRRGVVPAVVTALP